MFAWDTGTDLELLSQNYRVCGGSFFRRVVVAVGHIYVLRDGFGNVVFNNFSGFNRSTGFSCARTNLIAFVIRGIWNDIIRDQTPNNACA